MSSNKVNIPVVESRREFLEKCKDVLAGITVVGVAAPLMQACEISRVLGTSQPPANTNEIKIDVSTLTADNQALITTELGRDGMPILVVRESATTYKAFSMECTHARCEIGAPISGIMVCPCHGSRFNLKGEVIKSVTPGQPPLKSYTATYDSTTGKLTITFA